MIKEALYRIRSVSLKWKLLIPLLVISFVGATALVAIGWRSQEQLIKREEKKELLQLYRIFLREIEHKKRQAISLAAVVAEDPKGAALLREEDRKGLMEHFLPLYEKLHSEFEIAQFHFHVPPGKSFLRLHMLELSGEMIAYRGQIAEVMRTRKAVAGLEWGWSGLGIRGVVPVLHQGDLVGTVEIGFPFGKGFLDQLKQSWNCDLTVYEIMGRGIYHELASTAVSSPPMVPAPEWMDAVLLAPVVLISPENLEDRSIVIGAVRDYGGGLVALVQIEVSRMEIEKRLERARGLMLWVAFGSIAVAFFLIWILAVLFVRPIREIVEESREIAEGHRESLLEQRPRDEMGVLTDSLNAMLQSLKEKRIQLEDYARTLERRVEERTADLVSSEEKYRTLVENLPLIVYRILEDGTTEFINPYFTEKLGYTTEEVVGDKTFWPEKICGVGPAITDSILKACWEGGTGYRVERVVKDKDGNLSTFMDHAIPMRDPQGRVRWIDGIMVDITQLKSLQERAVRTEEIRVLGEISERFAHEFRNPLATVGGFARRLHQSLPPGDERRKLARIVVDEVGRMEALLRIMLSSIEPVTLCVSRVDLNQVLRENLEALRPRMEEKGIQVAESLSESMPFIQGDEELLSRAFHNLLGTAVVSIPPHEELFVTTEGRKGDVSVTVRHPAVGLAEEDLGQFFIPRLTGTGEEEVEDLPLANVIIHRHGGKIDLSREEGNFLCIRVELPVELGMGSFAREPGRRGVQKVE